MKVVYFLSKVEKLLNRFIPVMVRTILVPLISMVIVFPISLGIIGPVVQQLSNVLATSFTSAYNLNPIVAGAIIGGLWTATIVTGLHWGLFPVVMNKKMCPTRTLNYTRNDRTALGHCVSLSYIAAVCV